VNSNTSALTGFLFGGVAGLMIAGLGMYLGMSFRPPNPVTIAHPNGSELVMGTLGFDSPYVFLRSPGGKQAMDIMATPTGHSLLEMRNPQTGQPALLIDTATPTGAARILLYDPATGEVAKAITFDSP
jgi:hypothetical protein